MSALDFDNLEIEPTITAEEFALELEPAEGPFYDAVPQGGTCEEFGMQVGDKIIPCGDIAVGVVHHAKDRRDYLMCLPHLMHNVNNRGGVMKVAPREPEPAPVAATAPLESAALMQILPAGFPLPQLIKFVPDPALRLAADEAAKFALSLEVQGPEGVQRADAACTALRRAIKSMEAPFDEPREIANRLHKHITGTLAEWSAGPKAALQTVGGRVAREQSRLQAEAAEARRRAQAEEDRKARERMRAEAEAAAKQKAPAPVVEEMKRQAETVTAPPVPEPAPAPKLADSTVVKTWKCRPKGSSGEADPNPALEDMTVAQKAAFMELIKAIASGEMPLIGVQPDYSYLNARAKADAKAFDIPGFEAFEHISLRAKGGRGR